MKEVFCRHFTARASSGLYADSYGCQSFERELVFLPPRIETVFLLHYVQRGEGLLTIDGKAFPLREGDLFYCPTGVPITYHSSITRPYAYTWITFGGEEAKKWLSCCGFRPTTPVLRSEKREQIASRMRALSEEDNASEARVLSDLYAIFDLLGGKMEAHASGNSYAQKAMAILKSNFADPTLRIRTVASALHVSPEYLSKVFVEQTGKTAKQALTQLRLSFAAELLAQGEWVQEAASKSGYDDPALFSRSFKKAYGVSPRAYAQASRADEKKNP